MKKQRFYDFLWAVIVFFAYGCKEKEATPPSAEFAISYKNIKEPLRAPMIVEFTAQEDGATYKWGYVGVSTSGSSSSKTVSVKFTQSGSQNISLTTTKNGISSTKSQTINVLPAYTNARIKKVTLSSFPATNNGSSWDNIIGGGINNNADVFGELKGASGTVLVTLTTADNASPTAGVIWNFTTPFLINSVYNGLPITLSYYDSDNAGASSEYIGGIQFTVSNFITEVEGSRYPTTISGGTTTPTVIELDWQ